MYVILLLILIIVLLSKETVKNSKVIYLGYALIFAIFLSTLHETVGTDSIAYKNIFNQSTNLKNEFELIRSGFLLREMMAFLKKIGFTYFAFRVVIINIIFWLFFYSIKKLFKKDERIYIYMLFFSSGILLNYSLNGIKQGLAMGLYYFAISIKHKFLRYLIYILAILFHNLLIVPIVLGIFIKKMNKKIIFILFLMTFFIGTYLKNILLYISKYIGGVTYYLHYFKENAFGVSYNFFNYLEYQVPFIILFLFCKNFEDVKNKNMLKMFCLEVILVNILINQKVAAIRLSAFFSIYQFYAYYFILNKLTKKKRIREILFICICVLFFIVRVRGWEYLFAWI